MEGLCEQQCRNNVLLGIMWMLWIAVFSLNYIAFFHDYSRYSDGIFLEFFGVQLTFKTFSFLAGVATVILDGMGMHGLMGDTPPFRGWSGIARAIIPIIIVSIGLGVIFHNYFISVPGEGKNPDKDPVLSTRWQRVALYVAIMIIDLAMVILSLSFDLNKMVPDPNLVNVFGGGFTDYGMQAAAEMCKREGLTFGKVMSLIFGIGGVLADAKSAHTQYLYEPEDYELPQTWD